MTVALKIRKPSDVIDVIREDLQGKDREHLFLISLNSKNNFLSKDLISIGTVTETLTSPREIFKIALINNAVSIILVHNHPSGDPNPSLHDLKISKKIAEIGEILEVPLLDHIIFCDQAYSSIKQQIEMRKEVKNN